MKPFRRMSPCSSSSEHRLQSYLPFVYLYRDHFASIDTIDQFLSYLDSDISTKSAEVRLAERIFMFCILNARTWYCESFYLKTEGLTRNPLQPASEWGKAVAETFFEWSETRNIL